MVPCFNEAEQLPQTLVELPRSLEGVSVQILVVDDGSVDESVAIARSFGVEVLELSHIGLAQAFYAGFQKAINANFDYLITLDADGQYDPAYIPEILNLLIEEKTDVVLVERNKEFYQRMSRLRRWGHFVGAWAFVKLTRLNIHDPVSGYRGYNLSSTAALKVKSRYTYLYFIHYTN